MFLWVSEPVTKRCVMALYRKLPYIDSQYSKHFVSNSMHHWMLIVDKTRLLIYSWQVWRGRGTPIFGIPFIRVVHNKQMRPKSLVIKPDMIYPPPVTIVLFTIIKKLYFGFSEKVRLVFFGFALSEKIRLLFSGLAFWPLPETWHLRYWCWLLPLIFGPARGLVRAAKILRAARAGPGQSLWRSTNISKTVRDIKILIDFGVQW